MSKLPELDTDYLFPAQPAKQGQDNAKRQNPGTQEPRKPESQKAEKPPSQKTSRKPSLHARVKASLEAGHTDRKEKCTFEIAETYINRMKEVKFKLDTQHGIKVSMSEMIEEALKEYLPKIEKQIS
jgi:hypothetical protein